jgi:hypothetical protein
MQKKKLNNVIPHKEKEKIVKAKTPGRGERWTLSRGKDNVCNICKE